MPLEEDEIGSRSRAQPRTGLSIIKPGSPEWRKGMFSFSSAQRQIRKHPKPVYFSSFISPMPTIFDEVRNFL